MNRRFSFLSAFALLIAACEAVAPLDDVEVAADASDSADAGLPPGPDGMIAPDPDAAAPTPDAAAPVPDAALPIPDAAAPAPDAAAPTPDAAAPLPDAAAPQPDAAPMCLIDADCAPQLCRGGVCVDRVQLVADVPPLIDAPDPVDVITLQADADPFPDLAILSGATSEVYVLIGAGDGTFGPRFGPFPVGPGPVALAKGNFDDDQLEDIVVANNGDGSLTVLHALGDGDFTVDAAVNAAFVPGPDGAAAVAIGEVDGNGRDDVVVADQASSALELLVGTRPPVDPGYLAAPQPIANIPRPSSLTARPLSAGASPSIVGVDAGNGSAFVYQDLGGGFQLMLGWTPADGPLTRVTLADVDENGVEDLVGTVPGNNRVVIRFDAGGEASLASGAQPTDARAADLDGDGHLDAVMVHGDDGTVGVNCGDGTGGFERDLRTFNAGPGPTRLVTDDLDFDGLPDVLVIGGLDQRVDVLMNRSPGP